MPSSAASTAIEAVVHYKKKLLRHVADENPGVILHCLTKLERVAMTVDILQETGIGRVVNSLKKALDVESRVAQIAKGIVTKWKDIVANHQEQQEEEEEETEEDLEQEERNEQVDNGNDKDVRTEAEAKPGDVVPSTSTTAKPPPDEKRSSSSSSKHHKHKKHHKEKDADKANSSGGGGKKHKKDKKESTKHHHHHHKSGGQKKEKRDHRVVETAEQPEQLKTPSNGGGGGGGSSLVSVPNDINPNYRPASSSHLYAPLSTDYVPSSPPPPPTTTPRSLRRTDDEQLSALMSKKGTRNSMYSGVKRSVFKEVPTLKDICVLLLQENVDYIEQCGGLPFELLEPILNRASPQTLMNIEEYNQYLMERTGPTWERHCKKEFPKGVREEFESFREMYERCTRERAVKLEALTAKMGTSYKNAKDSVRKTKLAYVNTVAKPPRSAKRAQEKNGTSAQQPSSGSKRGRPLSAGGGGGETRGSGHQPPKKAKIAPMMAKSLKLARGLKGGFRR